MLTAAGAAFRCEPKTLHLRTVIHLHATARVVTWKPNKILVLRRQAALHCTFNVVVGPEQKINTGNRIEIDTDHHTPTSITRKLCYRKDDRAMRHIYECPESFWMYIGNLKCVTLAIGVLVGSCEPQSSEKGGRRQSRIVPFERALVTPYRPSTVTFPQS